MERQEFLRMSRRELLRLGGMALAGSTAAFRVSPAVVRAQTPALSAPCAGSGVIEMFPTSPLILNPFSDPLPVPQPLAPAPLASVASWPSKPGSGVGLQDSDGGTHQIWPTQLGLPDPVIYEIRVQCREHSFSSSSVRPIDAGGNAVLLPAGTPCAQNGDFTVPSLPKSCIYGFEGTFPGPMINAEYGKPIVVRFRNSLDGTWDPAYLNEYQHIDRCDFGAEDWAYLTHLHNGHTAPESDGNPHYRPSAYRPGQWCDNLYLNWPAGGDDREKQSFMWFHDHRMDQTGANVYKGMVGLYPIYDPKFDSGSETKGYRLPGVRTNLANGTFKVDYDLPLALYDCRLDNGTTPHQDFHNGCGETRPEWWGKTFFRHFPNHGFVGDLFTVNGKAFPVLEVKRRRYRLRFLDASIARIYELKLMSPGTRGPVAAVDTARRNHPADPGTGENVQLQGQYQLPDGQQCMKMVQIASEGGLLPFPILRDSIEVWPAKRREVIVDFSKYMDGTPTTKGDVIYLVNVKQMTTGRKPNEAMITANEETGARLATPFPDPDFDPDFRVPVLKIVIGDNAADNSIDPLVYANGTCSLALNATTGLPLLAMRALPPVPRSFKGIAANTFELQRSGQFGGEIQWLINGRPFDPTTPLAYPLVGTGQLWTIRNGGGGWVHPLHLHMEEHRVISRNGVATKPPTDPSLYNRSYQGHDHPDDVGKEDVVALDPSETVVIYRNFRTFRGPYVAHCHNLAHEDHAMMFGWSIV